MFYLVTEKTKTSTYLLNTVFILIEWQPFYFSIPQKIVIQLEVPFKWRLPFYFS